jgi:hypothetical protein
MDVFSGITGFLTLLPYIIAGAQQLHHGASGADKKQAVINLAQVGIAAAQMASPAHAAQIGEATGHIGTAIDGIVGTLNAFGILKHETATPAQAQVAVAGN